MRPPAPCSTAAAQRTLGQSRCRACFIASFVSSSSLCCSLSAPQPSTCAQMQPSPRRGGLPPGCRGSLSDRRGQGSDERPYSAPLRPAQLRHPPRCNGAGSFGEPWAYAPPALPDPPKPARRQLALNTAGRASSSWVIDNGRRDGCVGFKNDGRESACGSRLSSTAVAGYSNTTSISLI